MYPATSMAGHVAGAPAYYTAPPAPPVYTSPLPPSLNTTYPANAVMPTNYPQAQSHNVMPQYPPVSREVSRAMPAEGRGYGESMEARNAVAIEKAQQSLNAASGQLGAVEALNASVDPARLASGRGMEATIQEMVAAQKETWQTLEAIKSSINDNSACIDEVRQQFNTILQGGGNQQAWTPITPYQAGMP
eukprot:TRINITY_DN18388_c0_g1_i1.p1 TRINITY_DN18388_c0_g1~~TRINITY_DN18388_c0_g1_i1.p1  ORF type:complete len:190 (-),score=30.71 TRINITY_DN18388_c0_g1_i1:88-657(-)